jgi:hypothetical protein
MKLFVQVLALSAVAVAQVTKTDFNNGAEDDIGRSMWERRADSIRVTTNDVFEACDLDNSGYLDTKKESSCLSSLADYCGKEYDAAGERTSFIELNAHKLVDTLRNLASGDGRTEAELEADADFEFSDAESKKLLEDSWAVLDLNEDGVLSGAVELEGLRVAQKSILDAKALLEFDMANPAGKLSGAALIETGSKLNKDAFFGHFQKHAEPGLSMIGADGSLMHGFNFLSLRAASHPSKKARKGKKFL